MEEPSRKGGFFQGSKAAKQSKSERKDQAKKQKTRLKFPSHQKKIDEKMTISKYWDSLGKERKNPNMTKQKTQTHKEREGESERRTLLRWRKFIQGWERGEVGPSARAHSRRVWKLESG